MKWKVFAIIFIVLLSSCVADNAWSSQKFIGNDDSTQSMTTRKSFENVKDSWDAFYDKVQRNVLENCCFEWLLEPEEQEPTYDEALSALSSCSSLVSLKIETRVNDDIQALADAFVKFMQNNTSLQTLDLFGQSFRRHTVLTVINQAPNLRWVKLACFLGASNLEDVFAKMLQTNTKILSLNLYNNGLNRGSMFSMLQYNSTLTHLDLSEGEGMEEYSYTDTLIPDLCNGIAGNTTLFKLALNGHYFTRALLTSLEKPLTTNTTLHFLNLKLMDLYTPNNSSDNEKSYPKYFQQNKCWITLSD